ncbi:MAG: biotin--[acetyl-CoA-carboxylase] ligase [Pseudomonadota bacterium]
MTWPAGVGRMELVETDSTSLEARRRAEAGATGPVWILARRQTAARGRRGRAWVAPEGNFAATLLMQVPEGPEAAAERSFVAALALRDALIAAGLAPDRLALKWPNDVLLDGGKVAGILLETVPTTPLALLIGIGVNLAHCPDAEAVEQGAVTPVAAGSIPPETLLDHLGPAFAGWEARRRNDGFASIRRAWLEGAARLGEPITARLPDRTLEGVFEGIDPSGALLLATPTGRQTLPAAEVHFPAEAL